MNSHVWWCFTVYKELSHLNVIWSNNSPVEQVRHVLLTPKWRWRYKGLERLKNMPKGTRPRMAGMHENCDLLYQYLWKRFDLYLGTRSISEARNTTSWHCATHYFISMYSPSILVLFLFHEASRSGGDCVEKASCYFSSQEEEMCFAMRPHVAVPESVRSWKEQGESVDLTM